MQIVVTGHAEVPEAPKAPEGPVRHPLDFFLARGFYDVLGVEPGAELKEIKKAFRSLSLIYHPDKGGDADTFKFILMVFGVLSDRKHRAKYDREGKASFMGSFANMGPKTDAQDGVRTVLEPINVMHPDIVDILSRRAAGLFTVKKEADWATGEVKVVGSLRQLWSNLKLRAGNSGNLLVIWRRDKVYQHTGLPGRFYSGVHQRDQVPEEFQARLLDELPMYTQTASPFDLFPRVIKELFRLGLNIQDLDQPKSFPTAMITRHPWSVHLRRWCEAWWGVGG
jgi:hypothetical protein